MVHILGINLPDNQLARFALTSIYGVGHHTSHRLCARFQIHDRCRVKDLTPFQTTALASFLSSPQTALPLPKQPLASTDFVPKPPNKPVSEIQAELAAEASKSKEPLTQLKIESELRREIRENIARQRMIGSYVGRRHSMSLPVRGQNTRSNAKTAKKLNKLERW
ncbi:hypothetical protein GYMLUDRAFT_1009823 [Collybiopsis luxurians FD-317 M1]|uniref:Small ribosomal subunit protein uS13m n=1 Tax=Collybiopsis luxurians FD-317 M1 TaxID=944289 RepID=A0A0D0CQG2_9AGAR|nr:hypothetical protein GYMLUDRAFT_1009823 [Collybiopsis luxurians FD-317 M1]